MIFALALKSLRNRTATAGLTVLSIALAVMLLLGVERIRTESREGFAATISGTDLIVGARTSPAHLLLYSVFRIGNPTNNLRWASYRAIAQRREVAWTIPLSLGDSHRGFRVLGTTADYFAHYRFSRGRRLELASGRVFEKTHDAVLGAEVAEKLNYKVGDRLVIAHGAGEVSFSLHEEQPFEIVGVLARTGTPVDRTVHVTLDGLDALHAKEQEAADALAELLQGAPNEHRAGVGSAHTISAFLVGLKSRPAALAMQRVINEYPGEPLTAILPGVTLQEIWEIAGAIEKTLFAVSALVLVVGLAGMLVALLTSLAERRREMAILRSVGARPAHVFGLMLGEAAFLTLLGIAVGLAALYLALLAGRPWLESRLGLFLTVGPPSTHEFGLMIVVAMAGLVIGLLPAYRIYRYSLADGMTIRI
ncbi:MAG TPA: ABC transporter permease [Burkholderiales bacterium]|jgi:putative ABC transport system permease protein|nr:ABC transporter permease [Burkholderiales bacterium]